ncbi:MerR family DNA-binding transcriptional regulator [Variovorax gossypii]
MATRSGVNAKMIRHYESLGFLPKISRTDFDYRQYTRTMCTRCGSFEGRVRLGFSVAEIDGRTAPSS